MTAKTEPTYPALTKKEARFLNDLAQAATYYRRALEVLKRSADSELALMANFHRTERIGNQALVESATCQTRLQTMLEASWYAYDMEDGKAWEACVRLAYTGEVDWFQPAEGL